MRGAVLALPAGEVEPVCALCRIRRVEAEGAGRLAPVGRLADLQVEGGGHVRAGVHRDQEGDGPDRRHRGDGERGSRHPLPPLHGRRQAAPDEAADHAAGDGGDQAGDRALGEEGRRPGVDHPDVRPGPLAREADGADAEAGERAEADRPLRGVAAAQVEEGDRLDHQRLDRVEGEVRGDLAEQRPDQEGEQSADHEEADQRAERSARSDPDPRRDQADPGGQHDQGGVEGERELRHAEVEFALEGRERDQEGAGEDQLAEAGEAPEIAARGLALLVALGVERPGAEHRERGAADQHQVGGAPEGHVLAEDPVPDVVEGEGGQGARAAGRDHQRADRSVPARRDLVRGPRRLVGQGEAEHARGQHQEEAGEDEVVGGVGERAGVASLVDVQGDVPVHAEDRDQERHPEQRAREGGPAGQPGRLLVERRELAEQREAALLVEEDRSHQQDRHHDRAGGRVDHVGGGSPSRRWSARPEQSGGEHRFLLYEVPAAIASGAGWGPRRRRSRTVSRDHWNGSVSSMNSVSSWTIRSGASSIGQWPEPSIST